MNRLTIVTVALLGWLFAAPAFSADLSSPPGIAAPLEASAVQSTDDLIRLTTLLTAVNRFKQVSIGNYEKALLMFATDDAVAKFRRFSQDIWAETPPAMGWSYFMSSSVHAVGAEGRQQPLVAFYNPWSDVFLITEWRMDEDIPHLVDAEMLMGDWLRPGKELSLVPNWLRTNTFKPAALGISVAQSIHEFEERFKTTGAASWRKQLPVLENQQLLTEVNYPAVSLMLLNNLQNINAFRTLKKENNPRIATCRRLTVDVIRAGAQGQIERSRKTADDTLPETWDVLKGVDTKWFRTLEAVAVIDGNDGCQVFLSPVFDVNGSLSLFFKGKKADLRLKRIDVIDYSGFYQGMKGKGEAPRKELSL
ncbi:MAG: hypothetical protein ABFE02_06760 [Sulfuricella sp.]